MNDELELVDSVVAELFLNEAPGRLARQLVVVVHWVGVTDCTHAQGSTDRDYGCKSSFSEELDAQAEEPWMMCGDVYRILEIHDEEVTLLVVLNEKGRS